MDELEAWEAEAPKAGVDTGALDALIQEYKATELKYKEQKALASEYAAEVEKLEAKIVDTLQAAGKSKYFVDGLGTAYLLNRYAVRTPKTNEEKQKFFDYIEKKYGHDVFLSKVGVNSQTLQGFYKQEIEALQSEGVADPTIPGLEAPTHEVSLGFRKG